MKKTQRYPETFPERPVIYSLGNWLWDVACSIRGP